MNDVRRAYVTLAPRGSKERLFSAPDLHTALERIRASPDQGARRLAIWTDAPAPERGADVVVCGPVARFEHRRAQAEEVVARWDDVWLLIESVPRRHREAAGQHLVDEITMALLAAAIEGVCDPRVVHDPNLGF